MGGKRKGREREREALGEAEFERAVRDKLLFLESEIDTSAEDEAAAIERECARLAGHGKMNVCKTGQERDGRPRGYWVEESDAPGGIERMG